MKKLRKDKQMEELAAQLVKSNLMKDKIVKTVVGGLIGLAATTAFEKGYDKIMLARRLSKVL